MDNFDELDEKLFIEINLSRDVMSSSSFITASSGGGEAHENLLQGDNSKLVMQARSPYTKLAFIKALKDNLICLGYLQEAVDTLNSLNEESISSAMFTSNKKQKKQLTHKRSHEKPPTSSIETYEVVGQCL
jgi:hypothetical protein